MKEALKIWEERLAFLRQQEAIASDAGQKFTLKKQIQETQEKIVEIAGDADDKLTVQRIAPTKLTRAADHLFGREQELSGLDQVWNDPSRKVLTIVAWGGVGKTALVFEWMARQAAKNWQGVERVFDWSFFSQGTREEGGASADTFIAAALRFFGDEKMADSSDSAWDKGARLAQLISQQRSLLVLDGIEPLQHPPGPLAGELKDPALAMLLKGLARQNSGLCIVTTRERVTDLAAFRDTTAPEWALHQLSTPAGVELLKNFGVHGTSGEFESLVKEVKGHALTLNLLGRYLAKAHQGDIRKRDQVKFEKADAKVQGGYAFKTIGAYEKWLSKGGEDGARALTVLRLMGLFDRAADGGCLNALRSDPPIEGLTELLTGLDDTDWNIAVASLADCGLVSVQSIESPLESSQFGIDAHPLIREYFAKQLKDKNPEAWRAAHRRLYEYLRDNTNEGDQPTLEDLQPLYQAIAHGCHAGLHQETRDEVYYNRLMRGQEFYSSRKLGALGSNLGAVAYFFEMPWSRISPLLGEVTQAWMLNEAAFYLRALGRMTETLEVMRAALAEVSRQESWRNVAIITSNLSELELTLGEVGRAVEDGEQSVIHAERSDEPFLRLTRLGKLADPLHQAGRKVEALEKFREAESTLAELSPGTPWLYSLQGFTYCDLLLADAEVVVWRVMQKSEVIGKKSKILGSSRYVDLLEKCRDVALRASRTIKVAEQHMGPLDISFDHLTLGRAALYAAILNNTELTIAEPEIESAVTGLRRASQQQYVPGGLLTRAWLRFLTGARSGTESAQTDLNEAWEVAESGLMRLHMADIHLYRARLFGPVSGKIVGEADRIEYPWNKNPDGSQRGPRDDLAAARKLIEQCGYWRRREELEDAEKAAKNW